MIENNVLARGGLYMDEMTKKLRLLHPDHHQLSHDLVAGCDEYRQGKQDFQKNVLTVIATLERMTHAVDRAKMDTFGKRSRLMAITWQRDISQQRLRQEIAEKKALLERRRGHHQSLINRQNSISIHLQDSLFRLLN